MVLLRGEQLLCVLSGGQQPLSLPFALTVDVRVVYSPTLYRRQFRRVEVSDRFTVLRSLLGRINLILREL